MKEWVPLKVFKEKIQTAAPPPSTSEASCRSRTIQWTRESWVSGAGAPRGLFSWGSNLGSCCESGEGGKEVGLSGEGTNKEPVKG